MNSPRVWVLSDGAAGNARQALALGGRLGTVTREISLSARAPWRWLAPRLLPGARHAFGAETLELPAADAPDVAVGCGRQAALATRLLRMQGIGVVQILAPRIDTRHWDLVVAPAHDGLRGANVIQTLGSLHEVNQAWLAQAQRDWPQFAALPSPRSVLLLGGPTAAAPLSGDDWKHLAGQLRNWLARDGGSLLISSSRRTPAWLSAAARSDLGDLPGLQWHSAVDGPNPYAGLLGWADRIVVSADSVNMISEACATTAPVYVPLPHTPHGRLAVFHRALIASGRLRPLTYDHARLSVTPLSELDSVVETVRARLHLTGTASPEISSLSAKA